MQKDLVEMMELKFEEFEDKVKETIHDELKNHNLKTKVNNRSFASVSNDRKIVPELRKIIQDEKLRVKEKREHILRKANLMVFSVSESGEDEEFAKDLIEDVGVKAEVKYALRIGNKKADQVRPIKTVTGSSHQQNLIIQSLINLKREFTIPENQCD